MDSKQRFSFEITRKDTAMFIRASDVIRWFVYMRLPTSLSAEEIKTSKTALGRLNFNYTGRPFGTLLMLYARKIEKEDAHYLFYQTQFLTTVTKDLSETAAKRKLDELLLNLLGNFKEKLDGYDNDRMVMALLLTSNLVNSHLVNGDYERGANIAKWLEKYIYFALDFFFAQYQKESYWKRLQTSHHKLLDDLPEALAAEKKQPQPTKQKISCVIGSKDDIYRMPMCQRTVSSGVKRRADTDTRTGTVFGETDDGSAPEVKQRQIVSTVTKEAQPQHRSQTTTGNVDSPVLQQQQQQQQQQQHNQLDGSLTVANAGTSSGSHERDPVQRSVSTPSRGIILEECDLSVEDVIFDSLDYMDEPFPELFADLDEEADLDPDQTDG